MAVQFSIRGLSQLTTKIANAAVKSKPVMASDLLKFGQLILNDAKERYVPVDKTILQQSGQVEMVEDSGWTNTVAVRLSFGGAAAAYAIAIHELPDYNPPTWNGTNVSFTRGGPKYLELPVMAHSKDLPNIASQIWVRLWTGLEKVG